MRNFTFRLTKQYRFIVRLTILLHLSFFRHKKDSGGWSTYKVEEVSALSCILDLKIRFMEVFNENLSKIYENVYDHNVDALVSLFFSGKCVPHKTPYHNGKYNIGPNWLFIP